MIPRLATATLATLTLAGCASFGAPSADELDRLPVVRFGDPAPAGQPFILLYPAGAPLPVEARIHGSLLEGEARSTLTVRTRQDLYTYKHWASLNGKNWKAGHDVVGGNFEIRVPGEQDGRNPGSMRAEFNLK